MAEETHLEENIRFSDLVITGEGKLDRQSLMGKVLSGIKRHAGDIPIVAFCGICEIPSKELDCIGINVVEIGRGIPLEEAIANGSKYLKEKASIYFESNGGDLA